MLMDLGVMISHLGGREKSMGDKWERNEEHLGNGRESRWNSVDGKSKRKYVATRMESQGYREICCAYKLGKLTKQVGNT